jgi:threonine dehydrogenase-like Zn-dependent dehydrogenase
MSVNFSDIVANEIRLVGSRCGPFVPALRLLENHLIDPTVLIDSCFPITKALQAFEHVVQSGTFKVLFCF